MEDFSTALHLVRPSIQGASDMFITNKKPISWDDIGGLTDIKQQLFQVFHANLCQHFSFTVYLLVSLRGRMD
jgi:SpoVK/Ycf46/Vps4 family AAA+-type ATPase